MSERGDALVAEYLDVAFLVVLMFAPIASDAYLAGRLR